MRLTYRELEEAWPIFLGHIPWEQAIAPTFRRELHPSVSRELASREVFRWCGDAARTLRKTLAWIYATERHKSGRWHAHLLMVGAGDASWEVPLALWRQRNGRIDIKRVYEPFGAVRYLSKWAALDGEVVCSDTLLRYRKLLEPSSVPSAPSAPP